MLQVLVRLFNGLPLYALKIPQSKALYYHTCILIKEVGNNFCNCIATDLTESGYYSWAVHIAS